ncbi:hypothetical protein LCGC14_0513990 [marine sediment metagenome]|uniref:Uncharacterized protein n=1 Tax=marine sediment metagenome TaxID=412755 RepID=A0A0F9SJ16_9ZZZZ
MVSGREKNEVLLKFAGFQYKKRRVQYSGGRFTMWLWSYPGGRLMGQYESPPNIYDSLDAQAEWLLSKLANYTLQRMGEGAQATVIGIDAERWYEGDGATPAEAFAEAILSLVGEDDARQNNVA